MRKIYLLMPFGLIVLVFLSAYTFKNNFNHALTKADSLTTIEFQNKQIYNFNNNTLHFSNSFAGARLNNINQDNDSTFTISILPENSPINSSPWYAFKVWSTQTKNVYIHLKYPSTVHRYHPKITQNGKPWTDINDVKLNEQKNDAAFSLKISKDTLTVAAQEIITSSQTYLWIDSLARLPFIKKQIIGYSSLGKPIIALNSTESNGKARVVILSRQHPPEVTGFLAMQEFIRTTLSNDELSKKFRQSFEIVIIPLINPDGVDEGNWRHSAAGVDLNRDWDNFKQPETKAIKDYLVNSTEKQNAKVYFGLDFHSTYDDVLYSNEEQATSNLPGFTNIWLAAFEQAIPGIKLNVRASGNGGNVSKSWMSRALQAEALTYEVGDKTERVLLKTKGRVAAEKMMELLLEKNIKTK